MALIGPSRLTAMQQFVLWENITVTDLTIESSSAIRLPAGGHRLGNRGSADWNTINGTTAGRPSTEGAACERPTPRTYRDKLAFLAWVQGREGRYELVRGHVVMMGGASRNHGFIVSNLIVLLRSRLESREWQVIAEFGLDTAPGTLRFADSVVDRAGGADRD